MNTPILLELVKEFTEQLLLHERLKKHIKEPIQIKYKRNMVDKVDEVNKVVNKVDRKVRTKKYKNLTYKNLRCIMKENDIEIPVSSKTLRGCGKYVKNRYIKHYKKSPFQVSKSKSCFYSDNESKRVIKWIKDYFKIKKLTDQL